MVALKEILTDWNIQNSPGGTTVMYFGGGEGSEVISRDELGTFLGTIATSMVNTTSFTVRTTGRIIEDSTGEYIGDWTDPTPYTSTGTAAGSAWSNSTQLLVRWLTGVVADGRSVKGRTFLPGFTREAIGSGELEGGTRASVDAAANAFTVNSGLVVWRRPRRATGTGSGDLPARPGSSYDVTGASVWNELAVLRNRR